MKKSTSRFLYVTILLLICLYDSVTTKKHHRQQSAALTTDFSCVNGDRYQENKCNYCKCINGILLACSRTTCDGLPFYQMAKNCEIGLKWEEECNSCQCVRQYGTICTVKTCNGTNATTPIKPVPENIINKKQRSASIKRQRGNRIVNIHAKIRD